MDVVSSLLEAVESRSGARARDQFESAFRDSAFGYQLDLPMLVGNQRLEGAERRLADIDYEGLTTLSMENRSERVQVVLLRENILSRLNTVQEAFTSFAECTWHSNPLGDFRREVGHYQYRYDGPRYLAFHGDGNCVTLGVLLKSLCDHFIDDEPLSLYYCCGAEREYMHVFGIQHREGRGDSYVDPDQKIYCDVGEVDARYSPSLLGQLFSAGGFEIFEKLTSTEQSRLFASMSHDIMDTYRIYPGPIIYRHAPDLDEFSHHFRRARAIGVEQLYLDHDDYEWKGKYRSLQGREDEKPYFLAKLEEPIEIELPPRASLHVGFDSKVLPEEVATLSSVFFGRVPASISWDLESAVTHQVRSPEQPWMICFDDYQGPVQIAGKTLTPMTSRCGRFGIIGMGDLEGVLETGKEHVDFSLSTAENTRVSVVFPLNALALNRGYLRFEESRSTEPNSIAATCR